MNQLYDIQVEIDLIGNILKDNKKLIQVIDKLRAEDFYNERHKILYKDIVEMYREDIDINIATLANHLNKKLRSVGGMTYITEIYSQTLGRSVKDYVKIIKELSKKREIIRCCNQAIENLNNSDLGSAEVIASMQESFIDNHKTETITLAEVAYRTLEKIEVNSQNGGGIVGIKTGFQRLDNTLNGFQKSLLYFIAARPSMGKTAVTLNLIDNIDPSNKIALFSQEMDEYQIGTRLYAKRTAIENNTLARGAISDKDSDKLAKQCNEMSKVNNIFVNTDSGSTIEYIESECRRLKIKHGLDIVFIDHIGYLKAEKKQENRVKEVGYITKRLKALSKELQIPIVCLSQLSRAVEQRADKHPMLSDLRDSGSIEEDSDVIMFLYRDDYYAVRERRESSNPGVIEIGIQKNRDGEVGNIEFDFKAEYQLIQEKV